MTVRYHKVIAMKIKPEKMSVVDVVDYVKSNFASLLNAEC